MKPSRSHFRRNPGRTVRYQNLEPRQMLSGDVPALDAQIELARNFLGSYPETQYLVQGTSDVRLLGTQQDPGSSTFLFQQTSLGIPVDGAYLTVVQDADGHFQSVNGEGYANLTTSAAIFPTLDSLAAERIANVEFAGQPLTTSSQLVWTEWSQLAWQVDTYLGPVIESDLPADWSTLVNVHTGEVLSQSRPTGITQLLYNPNTTTGVNPRIVINDAIGPVGSRAYGSTFDSVVALPGCTGTLIASNVVLSARHCGSSAGDSIRFGDDSGNPDFVATVASVLLPAGSGSLLDGGDLSILTLTADVPTTIATPMKVIDLTDGLEGMLSAMVGYGLNGIGSTGHQGSADGFRWAGENIIDVYGVPADAFGMNIISTDFDDGSPGANTIPTGDQTPVTLEATTAPGDSGGPILVQFGTEWVVAGVLSGGTTSTSVYGDISWWTGVSPFRAEIVSAGGVFAEGNVSFDQNSYSVGDVVTVTVDGFQSMDPTIDVVVMSNSGDSETLTLNAVGPNYVGSIMISATSVVTGDGILQAEFGGEISVNFGPSSSDTASIEDQVIVGTNGNDVIEVEFGSTVRINVNGSDFFVNPTVQNTVQFDALLGHDQITITDGLGNEVTTLGEYYVNVDGFFSFHAISVEDVTVNSGGGFDTARMYGTNRDDLFASAGGTSTLTGPGFENRVNGYGRATAFAISGGVDRATFVDSAGSDRFYATPEIATMTTPDSVVSARGFDKIMAFATEGGFDYATFVGSDGNDTLYASSVLANMKGAGFEVNASKFERTSADGGAGFDTANLVGTSGNDIYYSTPQFGYLYGSGYFNQASRFENVIAHAGAGTDRANLYDSPGADSFLATPTYAVLMNGQYRSQANGFDQVSAFGTAGFDSAVLRDSAGVDRYIARPEDAYLVGNGYLNYTKGFNSVRAVSSGGNDIAVLHDSREDDRFFGSYNLSILTGSTFNHRAENFRRVTAYFTKGVDRGRFEDSAGDDTLIAKGNETSLFNDDYFVFAVGLDVVTAVSEQGGNDVLGKANLDLLLIEQGDWNQINSPGTNNRRLISRGFEGTKRRPEPRFFVPFPQPTDLFPEIGLGEFCVDGLETSIPVVDCLTEEL